MRHAAFALLLLLSGADAAAQSGPAGVLDFLAGHWTVRDPSGVTGSAHIVRQAPGAMIFELREMGPGGALPIWFEYSEGRGWAQLFPGPAGIREFPLLSDPGRWPLVFGANVRLRDGSPVRYRLSLFHASNDESRRLLEMSRDGGATWSTVFDYLYRRAAR